MFKQPKVRQAGLILFATTLLLILPNLTKVIGLLNGRVHFIAINNVTGPLPGPAWLCQPLRTPTTWTAII